MIRLVICCLPPLGGPIAVTRMISSIFWNGFYFVLRSYHPLWSIHCLRISMGGWAPYTYFLGIFKSSTNTTNFLPGVGPYTPFLLFSNLESSISWVWLALVWAENVIDMTWYSYGISLCIKPITLTVLPVPVGPGFIICLSWRINSFSRWRFLTLSFVGTIISAKESLLSTLNSGMMSSHFFQVLSTRSKQ